MPREHRLEILLVLVIVIVAAVFTRWAYIPPFADRHVAGAEEKYDFEVGEPSKWFSAWSLGDGQAYALIALDPTGDELAEHISEAGYRFARAGFGWATWAVSLGQPTMVPYALGIVGAMSVLTVLILAAQIRSRLGPRAWLLVLNPALYIGFAGDTSEPFGILLLALALASGSWIAAGLLGITRPTFLVAAWGKWRVLLIGTIAALALALYSLQAFGIDALVPAGGRLTAPLVAYLEHLSIWGILLALAALGTVALGVVRRDWSWILAGVFVLCFGSDVLRDPVNAWRAAGFLPVMWAFGPGYELSRVSERVASVSAST